jgi:hypothetical protein
MNSCNALTGLVIYCYGNQQLEISVVRIIDGSDDWLAGNRRSTVSIISSRVLWASAMCENFQNWLQELAIHYEILSVCIVRSLSRDPVVNFGQKLSIKWLRGGRFRPFSYCTPEINEIIRKILNLVPTVKLYLDNLILAPMDSIHMGTVPSKMALCRTLFNVYEHSGIDFILIHSLVLYWIQMTYYTETEQFNIFQTLYYKNFYKKCYKIL